MSGIPTEDSNSQPTIPEATLPQAMPKSGQGQPEDEIQELDNISSIALLIDDLSHEDPSIKINALTKLTSIAQLIGEQRTRDELLPLITDMIDKIDENSELMIVLAEQIGNLARFAGPKIHMPLLLKPLESIANNDEPTVRDKAVESIINISRDLSKEQHTSDLFPLVKRLSKGDLYPMRISATGLYQCLYPHITPLNQAVLRQMFVDLCKEDTPMVRRAAAINLSKFATVIDPFLLKSEFIQSIQALLSDPQDAVRVAAVDCATKILCQIKSEDVTTSLLPHLKACSNEVKSWRLRYMLAESTENLLGALTVTQIDQFVVEWMTKLLLDTEPEVRSQTTLCLGKLSCLATKKTFVDKFVPIFKNSTIKDPSEHVRSSLAKTVCAIGQNLGKELCEANIIPLCLSILKDDVADVRLTLLQNIHSIIEILDDAQIDAQIFPALNAVASDKQWRVRLEVVKYLPELARKISRPLFQTKIMPLFMNLLIDPTFNIRENATLNLIELGELFGKEWMESNILEKCNEFKVHPKCTFRINTLLMICRLKERLGKEFLNEKLYPIIDGLKGDAVPNIRINVAKTIECLAEKLSEDTLKKLAIPALQSLINDGDFDVKYFAEKALQNPRIRGLCF